MVLPRLPVPFCLTCPELDQIHTEFMQAPPRCEVQERRLQQGDPDESKCQHFSLQWCFLVRYEKSSFLLTFVHLCLCEPEFYFLKQLLHM